VVPPTAIPPTLVPLPPPTDGPQPGSAGEFADFFSTGEITGPLGQRGHRAASQLAPLARRLAAPLAAVVVVVVVILLLIWINGKPSGNRTGPGVVAPTVTAPVLVPPPTSHPTPKPPSTSHPTSHPTSAPPTPHHRSSTPAVPVGNTAMAPVVVLNNSTISGLAAAVANELHAKGWQIKSVGNQQSVIAETTLYYGAGKRAAARHLAKQFSQIRRIRSAAAAGIASYGSNLTLVVTRDWS
jgi:hypothetical protein